MEFRELSVEARSVRGSAAAKRLRREGMLPGIIYSQGKDAWAVSLDTHTFVQTARRSTPTQLFKLKSADAALNGKLALVKDIQIEPIKDTVLHVDFLAISEGHEIVLPVPIELVGEPAAVKLQGAVLSQPVYELEVACLPGNIPQKLEVDISSLEEGDSIHAGDIALPAGVRLKSGTGITVVSVVSGKEQAVSETAAAAPAEGAADAAPAASAEKKQ